MQVDQGRGDCNEEFRIQLLNCFPYLEGGSEIEEAPGEDDVVVGAEEEGDDDCANAGALQQGAQLAQRPNRSSPGRSRMKI